jgi:uroporphyrinogen-III synthase
MIGNARENLHGLKVVSFESRRAQEMAADSPHFAPGIGHAHSDGRRQAELFQRRHNFRTPLGVAIEKILRGGVDVALFTNGAQVEHLFRVAAYDKADAKLRLACNNLAIASVGPICTQVLDQYGLKPDVEPEHPKMGSLIAEVAASAHDVLAAKRGAQS